LGKLWHHHFFEDPSTYDALSGFKMYADKFESWRDQTSAMHQLLLWTALEMEGMGANVQHYNPLIDEQVKEAWSLDTRWRVTAQMVIGKPVGDLPATKDKKFVKDRYRVLSSKG
jgi:predicted oxidoreductase (fatty acid repression mutant protein)